LRTLLNSCASAFRVGVERNGGRRRRLCYSYRCDLSPLRTTSLPASQSLAAKMPYRVRTWVVCATRSLAKIDGKRISLGSAPNSHRHVHHVAGARRQAPQTTNSLRFSRFPAYGQAITFASLNHTSGLPDTRLGGRGRTQWCPIWTVARQIQDAEAKPFGERNLRQVRPGVAMELQIRLCRPWIWSSQNLRKPSAIPRQRIFLL